MKKNKWLNEWKNFKRKSKQQALLHWKEYKVQILFHKYREQQKKSEKYLSNVQIKKRDIPIILQMQILSFSIILI